MSNKINKTPLCACVIYNKNNPNNKNINEKERCINNRSFLRINPLR